MDKSCLKEYITKLLKKSLKVNVLAICLKRVLNVMHNRLFHEVESLGFHVMPVHYYSPIPDTREIMARTHEIFESNRKMTGLSMNEEKQKVFLEEVIAKYSKEVDFNTSVEPWEQQRKFSYHNAPFKNKDAEAYYSIIRHFEPNTIIEIGGGGTTILAAQAIRKNKSEGHETKLICIEPYPVEVQNGAPYLTEEIDCLECLVRKELQQVPLMFFEALSKNDILFIDSSHVAKIGSDVLYEILEILPILKPGVLIHFHDIFFPREYHKDWILKNNNFFWNEMYILHAFLLFNNSFEVIFGSSYMHHMYPDLVKKSLPYVDDQESGGSFWIQKVR